MLTNSSPRGFTESRLRQVLGSKPSGSTSSTTKWARPTSESKCRIRLTFLGIVWSPFSESSATGPSGTSGSTKQDRAVSLSGTRLPAGVRTTSGRRLQDAARSTPSDRRPLPAQPARAESHSRGGASAPPLRPRTRRSAKHWASLRQTALTDSPAKLITRFAQCLFSPTLFFGSTMRLYAHHASPLTTSGPLEGANSASIAATEPAASDG